MHFVALCCDRTRDIGVSIADFDFIYVAHDLLRSMCSRKERIPVSDRAGFRHFVIVSFCQWLPCSLQATAAPIDEASAIDINLRCKFLRGRKRHEATLCADPGNIWLEQTRAAKPLLLNCSAVGYLRASLLTNRETRHDRDAPTLSCQCTAWWHSFTGASGIVMSLPPASWHVFQSRGLRSGV